jgi:hypothetical protein
LSATKIVFFSFLWQQFLEFEAQVIARYGKKEMVHG